MTGVPPQAGSGHSVSDPSPDGLGHTASVPNAAKWVLLYDDDSEKMRVAYDLTSRWGPSVNVRMYDSDDNDLYVDVEDVRWMAAHLLAAASAIEAATAGETTKIRSTEGESAVGEAETPNPCGDSSHD